MDRESISRRSRMLYSKENMCQEYLNEYDIDGKKEKILLIDVNCKSSSTGKIVYDLYQYIKADNREAAICYGRGLLVKENNIFKFGIDIETALHALLARLTGYNGCFSPISTYRLIRFIDDYEPDLIHIHELHAYFVNIKSLIKHIKKRGIPVVWTFHCEYMYTGKCGHAYECLRFQSSCGDCPAVKEYPKSWFFDKTRQMLKSKEKLLLEWNFTIVTPSKWLADRVRLSFLKNKEIVVIHNGVDTEIFKPQFDNSLKEELGILPERKVALFVSPIAMDKRKGGQWVITIANRMKTANVTFIIVGDGSIPDIVPENVLFVGKIQDKDLLARYYSMADVFLLLSEKETYSMTCAEALCCGTPVVGFKSGAPETVFLDPDVKFVEYGNVEGLVQAINEKIKI